jgi:phage host-nuclease inhibitor protein Gam
MPYALRADEGGIMKPIETWDEADDLLQGLITCDGKIASEQNLMNDKCQEIKAKHGGIIKDYVTAQKEILETLESFFIAHEDDPEVEGKTYDGAFGKCGLRTTPPSVKPIGKMSWERVLARIIELGYKTKLLRPLVPSIKDIDRELLASEKTDEGTRKAIGVRLHQEERFWYEAK